MLPSCLQCWNDVATTVLISRESPGHLDDKTGVVLLISGCLGQGFDVPPRTQAPVPSRVPALQQTSANFSSKGREEGSHPVRATPPAFLRLCA